MRGCSSEVHATSHGKLQCSADLGAQMGWQLFLVESAVHCNINDRTIPVQADRACCGGFGSGLQDVTWMLEKDTVINHDCCFSHVKVGHTSAYVCQTDQHLQMTSRLSSRQR